MKVSGYIVSTCICISVLNFGSAPCVHAQQVLPTAVSYQSLSELQSLAETYIRNSITAKVGELHVKSEALDPRLHLAKCSNQPEAFLPSGANLSSRATVGLRCNQDAQWAIYVGVNIETEMPVLILNHSISRDAPLAATDVSVDVRRLPGLSSSYLTDIAQLKGLSAKHDLQGGILLTPAMLQPTVVIHRGQQITIQANAGGISVRTDAIALTDGSANGRIRVKNINTAKVLEAVVDNASVVHVDL